MKNTELREQFMRTMHRMRKLSISKRIPGLSKNEFMMMCILSGHCTEMMPPEAIRQSRRSRRLPNRGGRELHVSEIAAQMHISAPSASRTLRMMAEKGYVSQKLDEADRRNTYVCLTEEGRRKLISYQEEMEAFTSRVLDRMGDEAMEQLLVLWSRMADILEDELHKTEKGD